MSLQLHPALFLVGGMIAWIAFLALGAFALRRLTARLETAGVEMERSEDAHCGNVYGIDDQSDTAAYNAESVLCPKCGTRNEPAFHRCRECVSPVRPGGYAAD